MPFISNDNMLDQFYCKVLWTFFAFVWNLSEGTVDKERKSRLNMSLVSLVNDQIVLNKKNSQLHKNRVTPNPKLLGISKPGKLS